MTTTPQTLDDVPVRVAVLGDVSRRTTAGSALRDVIHECGRGRQTWAADAGRRRGASPMPENRGSSV
ncbi:DUF4180 domain-containing protein [Streptomyces lydicus]|uniref:DUF4180 domain-containing protein n=1 Tax=Streptomyces lydicus TaxID=47763 RepID=UPI001F5121F7|nr:DUF4180 domain-containing protein [Streptomyces lydicus]MCZ1011747.1 DUF4180 domain-containing protein [Streptomyces lydicus]